MSESNLSLKSASRRRWLDLLDKKTQKRLKTIILVSTWGWKLTWVVFGDDMIYRSTLRCERLLQLCGGPDDRLRAVIISDTYTEKASIKFDGFSLFASATFNLLQISLNILTPKLSLNPSWKSNLLKMHQLIIKYVITN